MNLLIDSSNIWLLNFVCSNHMKNYRIMFQSMDISNTSQVRTGDKKTRKFEDNQTIKVQTNQIIINRLMMFIKFQSLLAIS